MFNPAQRALLAGFFIKIAEIILTSVVVAVFMQVNAMAAITSGNIVGGLILVPIAVIIGLLFAAEG